MVVLIFNVTRGCIAGSIRAYRSFVHGSSRARERIQLVASPVPQVASARGSLVDERIERALGDRRIVLCLDELEKLSYSGFTGEVRSQLRGLADGNDAPLTLILASRISIGELFPKDPIETSPLASIVSEVRLGPFSEDVGRRFLQQRLESHRQQRFSAEEEGRLLSESVGHPGRLQALAFASYAERIKGENGDKDGVEPWIPPSG
jgi:hypothetical protein